MDLSDLNTFMPHGYCLLWNPLLLWLHVIADLLIAIAYYAIPLGLGYFLRQRKDFSHPHLLSLFAAFVFACGTSHLFAAISMWKTVYWLSGFVKIIVASISLFTVWYLFKLLPTIIKLPSISQLQIEINTRIQIQEELQQTNARLNALLNNMPGGVAVYEVINDGENFIFQDLNRAGERLDKIKREEVLNKTITEVFPGVKEFGLFDILQKVFRTGKAEHMPVSLYKDKRLTGYRDNYIYRLPSGEVVSIYTDKTEQEKILARFEKIASRIPGMVYQFRLCPNGHVSIPYTNEAIKDFFRLTPEEVSKDAISAFNCIHPDDYQNVMDAISYSAQTLTTWFCEFRLRFDDGTIRWLSGSSEPEKEEDGSILWHGFITDVSERKFNEAKIQALFDLSPIGFSLNDAATGDFVEINDAMLAGSGYSKKEFLKLSYWDLTPQDYAAQEQAQLESLRTTGRYGPYEKEYIRKDGSRYPVLLNGMLIKDVAGREFIWSIAENITERKKAEQRLKQSEARFRTTFEHAPIGVVNVNLDGQFIAVNQTFCDILGYSEKELLSMSVMDVIQVQDRAYHTQLMQQFASRKIQNICIEMQFLRKDQRLVWASLSVRVNCLENGAPDYFIATIENINERKRIQNEVLNTKNQLQATLDAIPDLLFELDLNGYYIDIHAQRTDLLAAPVEQILGKKIDDILPSNAVLIVMSALQEADKIGHSNGQQFSLMLSQGECWFELSVAKKQSNRSSAQPHFIVLSRDITDRKHIENQLRESEQKFRQLIKQAPLAMGLVNNEGEIEYINDRFEQLFGYHHSEIPTLKEWYLHAYPDESYRQKVLEIWTASVQKAAKNNTDIEPFEYNISCKDGSVRVILISGMIFSKGCLAIFVDVTERKHIEEKLRENENKLNTILDNVDAYIYIKDTHYRYQYANRLVRNLFKHPLKEIVGKTDEDFFDEFTVVNLHHNDSRVIEHGERLASEEINTNKDGSLRTAYLSVKQPLRYENGNIYGLCGISTDITERKSMEEALRASEEQFRTLFNQAPIGIAIIDSITGKIYKANQKYADIVGLSVEQMQQIDWMQITHPDDIQADLDNMALMNAGKINGFTMEKRYFRSDGSIVWVNLTVSPLRFHFRQNHPHHHCIIEDITARKTTEQKLRELNRDFVTFLENTSDFIYFKDKDSRFRFCSQTLANITHNSSWQDLIGKHDLEVFPKETAKIYYQEELPVFEKGEPLLNKIDPYYKKDGSTGWVSTCKWPVFDSDNKTVIGIFGISRDITELKQAEIELRIAATVFESQEGMMVTDANQIILKVNRAFSQITGYSAEEIIGKTPSIFSSKKHGKDFYSKLHNTLQEKGSWRGEIWSQRKNGEAFPIWETITAVKNNEGFISHFVATMIDITERKATEEYINQLAFYDPLTQLPNRRLLNERIKHGIEVNKRINHQMAVLMLDLDKFKAVNDTLGHAAGDELLCQVATRIQSRLRKTDTFARLGGDEFVILINEITHSESIARIAEEIIFNLSQPFVLNQKHKAYIGTSIGICLYPLHGDNIETLMDHADAALYYAKEQGRGCFAYFSEELTQKARERINLENRLHKAIEQQQFRVYFQPQIDIKTGLVKGAEALVRWYDPEYGCIMPEQFITLAEETGLILEIGKLVLRQVCILGKQWLDSGLSAVTLAVNVSPYQFSRVDIDTLVSEILAETGFPAQYLELEITESGLMDNQERALSILNSLHKKGIRLAIDDFGTGYSSLAYLKYFPLDVLKIDKTFIDDIPFLQDDVAITSTIISMARHLGLQVLAEGVETIAQLQFLQNQGCDIYQGYFYSKPLPQKEFETLLYSLDP